MGWKIIGIIAIILLVIAVGAGIYVAMTKTTESQKAGVIPNFSFEPHQMFGCANYRIPEDFTINVNSNRPVQNLNKVKK